MNLKLYKHPEENIIQYYIRWIKNLKLQVRKISPLFKGRKELGD